MGTLLQFLSGPSGKTSSMRVMSCFVVVVVVGTWAWVSIRKEALQPMDPEQMGLVLGVLGFKVYQHKAEIEKKQTERD